ncbi:lytic murein transglycosylase [Plastoroseomonas arctica]|uniref:Lytic murein transglycosylase n=1 Tax=Plastoroseomonas arctica TaxID=1509237 RepID=A0AAF1KHB5_9PROT|nr:lytic murein transglycosylase [Plastoroseomonas arctica]MBR0653759.1 lytic murein transglycosylase [Plastoroseomonas arctica]
MGTRRHLIFSTGALLSGCAASGSPAPTPIAAPVMAEPVQDGPQPSIPFDRFLDGLRADARRAGVREATLNRALGQVRPLQRVIELDRRQAETVLSWEEYRDRIVSPTRIQAGQRHYAENRELLQRIGARYRVSPRVVVAIWGMETNYGGNTGGFGVVESLATLAWEGRRASYFRGELLSALRILDAGHVTPERMRGSWAGAMGQPQFMPSNFERLAVDFDGDGRRDIWDSRPDALASIANYFAHFGWREGEDWGIAARAPTGFDPGSADPNARRALRDWARAGWRRADGGALPQTDAEAGIVVPNRSTSGEVYLGLTNFRVIRRYNPPVNYALAVGLLSERVA